MPVRTLRALLSCQPRRPRSLAQAVARLRFAHHSRTGTRRGRRALGCFAQAVLLLRFMRQRAAVADLARDNTVSLSSAYRYLHEALDVLADQAPDLADVIEDALKAGHEHLLLDGTSIPTDRIHDCGPGSDRWNSGKPPPEWVPPAPRRQRPSRLRPRRSTPMGFTGRTRRHPRPHRSPPPRPTALHPAAARGLPVLADKGHIGAGAGVRVPVRRPRRGQVLDRSTRGWNSYVNTDRSFVEHGIAHLKVRWRALARATLCPWRISAIVATALVLSIWENRY